LSRDVFVLDFEGGHLEQRLDNRLVGHLRDEDGVGLCLGQALETEDHVYGITDDRIVHLLVETDVPDQGLPGMDADPHREGLVDEGPHMMVDGRHGGLHLQGGGNGVVGVVAAGYGGAEDAQQAVAEVFIDDAPVLEDYFSDHPEEMVQDGHGTAGAELGRQYGEPPQIDIEDRQQANLFHYAFPGLGTVNDPFDHLLGDEFLEDIADAPFVFRQGFCFLVEPGVFQGDAHGGGDRLEELHVAVREFAADFVQYLDHPQDPSLGDKRHGKDGAGLKSRVPIEFRIEVTGAFGVGYDKGFPTGGGIAGDPLSEFEPEILQDLHVYMCMNIEGLPEDQMILLPQEQRAALNVHEGADHVHRLLDDLVEIEGGRCQNAADLLDEIHFPFPSAYGRFQMFQDDRQRDEGDQHIDLLFRLRDARRSPAPQQQHPVDLAAHFEGSKDGGFGRGGRKDFQTRQFGGGVEVRKDDGVTLLQHLVDQRSLVGIGVPLVEGDIHFRTVFQDGKP